MKAIDRLFTEIINGTTQFVIPVFQRDYTWTEPQLRELWNDVIHVARTGPGRGHFLGSIVYVPTGDSSAGFTKWLLIDGQQRLTTLMLMLAALRDHIQETDWQGNENDPTAKRIEAYFLKNVHEEGDRQHKLMLRRIDRATLRAIIDQEELPADASERINESYEFFREQLLDTDPADVYLGIGRLVIVDVTLDRNSDDPQLIFESLNSTGVDLSQSDLIRNFILMRLPENEQTRLYDLYWSKIESLFIGSEKVFDAFARDYLALKTHTKKQAKADEIYHTFRRHIGKSCDELEGLEETLKDMLRFARYHAAFSLGKNSTGALGESLSRVRHLVDVPATLIMRLFECHDHFGTLTEQKFIEALGLIESFVIRRAVCGLQTRGYWLVFANLAYKVREDTPFESLLVGLARHSENARYPTDKEFQLALHDRDLYSLRICRHLLERHENHDTREPTDTTQYTIEHIMPQNEKLIPAWQEMLGENWEEIQRTWLHRFGNLTLTGYNSTYSDRSFHEKKSISGGFNESSVRLNKFVREQAVWTQVEIEQRGVDLANRSLHIWPPLAVDQKLIDEAKHQEMRELASRRDVNLVKMSSKARELFEKLRHYILELDSDLLELAEAHSVSYHGPEFFLEVLPRKHNLTLLLPLDFNEVDDATGLAQDANQWKFFVNANYEGGVYLSINHEDDIEPVMPIIRQSHMVACT